jgi:alanine racemase
MPTPELAAATDLPADSYDPWVEIIGDGFHNNVREVSRLAAGRPILAVIKNNAYGIGDQTVGPLMNSFSEIGGIACVRVQEALAMRAAGVTKPILVMAEVTEPEMELLARFDVAASVWLDDAPARIERVASRLGHPVPVQLYVDSGMGREGMPYKRARPWIAEICRSNSAKVVGTFTMFVHEEEFDRVQLGRFEEIISWARGQGFELGTLHSSPTFEVFKLPDAHMDMVRPGNALFGNYPSAEGARDLAELKPVFRLRTRVIRVERLEPGESAGFYRSFIAERPTWIALLPVGHTDGYPPTARGTCEVLINDRLYPVIAGPNSAHTILDIGPDRTVDVGDVATLIGPDNPAILPHTVCERTGVRFLALITKLNARLRRRLV